jgi:hypothetical protein
MPNHARDPPLLVQLLHALGRWLGIIRPSSGGDMERPQAQHGLERPRRSLTELRAMVNSYCEAVPAELRSTSTLDVRLLDAQLAQVDAPAASLESDLLVLEMRAAAVQRA